MSIWPGETELEGCRQAGERGSRGPDDGEVRGKLDKTGLRLS